LGVNIGGGEDRFLGRRHTRSPCQLSIWAGVPQPRGFVVTTDVSRPVLRSDPHFPHFGSPPVTLSRSTPAVLTLARCSSVSMNPGSSMIHPTDTPAARALLAMLSKDGRACCAERMRQTLSGVIPASRATADCFLPLSRIACRGRTCQPDGESDAGLRIAGSSCQGNGFVPCEDSGAGPARQRDRTSRSSGHGPAALGSPVRYYAACGSTRLNRGPLGGLAGA
jgi:hypothetical protein